MGRDQEMEGGGERGEWWGGKRKWNGFYTYTDPTHGRPTVCAVNEY